MNFSTLVDQLITQTTEHSLWCFAPEIVISVTIVAILLVRLVNLDRFVPNYMFALLGAFAAFGVALWQGYEFANLDRTITVSVTDGLVSNPTVSPEQGSVIVKEGESGTSLVFTPTEGFSGRAKITYQAGEGEAAETSETYVDVFGNTFFTGLMVYDQFTIFFRVFLLLFLILTITLTVLTGIPDNEDGPDFYVLLLGATLGMVMMAEANHLLMLFIAIEMASVPSYVMVGFLKGRKASSEAALKYVVYGAGTAGVMLYGISLLCGLLGTGDLPEVANRIAIIMDGSSAEAAAVGISSASVRAIILGMTLVLVGLAFKLSLVPFHFWCPDAFEGAAAEVGGFLSVASKAGAFALLLRFVLAFAGEPSALSGAYLYLGLGLGFIGVITATYGNLTAYGQNNIKRLLAYSTIAHAGYMIMAVAALMVILNAGESGGAIDRGLAAAGAIEGLLYYLAVYMFMNLGAFAIVALIRNQTFSEELDDYRGLIPPP